MYLSECRRRPVLALAHARRAFPRGPPSPPATGRAFAAVEEDHRPRVALVRAAAEPLDACRRRSAAAASPSRIRAPVVAGLADVADHRSPISSQPWMLPSSVSTNSRSPGQTEFLEGAALRLPRDVLEAPAVDLAPGPRARALPARARLVGRIALVDPAREALVEIDVEVLLLTPDRTARRGRSRANGGSGGKSSWMNSQNSSKLGLVVAHEDRRHADRQVRRRARELEQRARASRARGRRAPGTARTRSWKSRKPSSETVTPSERSGRMSQILSAPRDDLVGARSRWSGSTTLKKPAALEVDADDLRQVPAQERLAAGDQEQANRRERRARSGRSPRA